MGLKMNRVSRSKQKKKNKRKVPARHQDTKKSKNKTQSPHLNKSISYLQEDKKKIDTESIILKKKRIWVKKIKLPEVKKSQKLNIYNNYKSLDNTTEKPQKNLTKKNYNRKYINSAESNTTEKKKISVNDKYLYSMNDIIGKNKSLIATIKNTFSLVRMGKFLRRLWTITKISVLRKKIDPETHQIIKKSVHLRRKIYNSKDKTLKLSFEILSEILRTPGLDIASSLAQCKLSMDERILFTAAFENKKSGPREL